MADALAARHCVPCGTGETPLGAAAVDALARDVPEWAVEATTLRRRFRFRDFDTAFAFATATGVAAIAAAEDHHPDIGVGWGYASFALTTHAIGGLSENDFIVAARIDRAAGGL